MANGWTTKEKIVLLSYILEHGDQNDSWPSISNDLTRIFQNNVVSSQTRREGRFSIKNCRKEYKSLVDRYKPEWIEQCNSNGTKSPLAKFISAQVKLIYQNELTIQLNESRKRLTEMCLRLENDLRIKSDTNETANTTLVTDTTTPVKNGQDIDRNEGKKISNENSFQINKNDISSNENIIAEQSNETLTETPQENDFQEENMADVDPAIINQSQMKKDENEATNESISNEYYPHIPLMSPPSQKENSNKIEDTLPQQTLTTHSFPSLQTLTDQQQTSSIQTVTNANLAAPESTSSSRSTSRTSSETKIDIIKVIPPVPPKYHVYFSPKNSTSNTTPSKTKPKRKTPDDIKDPTDTESANQQDLSSLSPATTTITTEQQSKLPSSANNNSITTTAPITRRSINTRSVPNVVAEQEEEKARRFSAMISENPNSWQSQSMAIIQYILAHKQGYLFEHEITDEIAPKYHQYIKRPIALDTIRKTLESNEYQSKDYFKRDIYLMLYNAIRYNPRNHRVHRAAKHLFNTAVSLFQLSAQEIHGQIANKNNVSTPTNTNDTPAAKRKRTK